ncbi:hypothetical protein AHF37_00626 [Paragonimus kellicotti]|nr:hypothetical protein AHF37_00626 [Paragonimus kellicotti]
MRNHTTDFYHQVKYLNLIQRIRTTQRIVGANDISVPSVEIATRLTRTARSVSRNGLQGQPCLTHCIDHWKQT